MSARDTVSAATEVPAPPRQPRFSLRSARDPGLARVLAYLSATRAGAVLVVLGTIAGRSAMAVVIAGEWATNLARLEDNL